MHNRLHRDLRIRFVAYFFLTMLAATVISCAASYFLIVRSLGNSLTKDLREMAVSLIETDGLLQDAQQNNPIDAYSVVALAPGDPAIAKFTGRLDNGEIVADRHWLLPTVDTYFRVGDTYYKLSSYFNSILIWQLITGIFSSVIAALVLGTLLASFSGARFLRPIRQLSAATEEVARGNFNVTVSETNNFEMAQLVKNFNRMTADLARTDTLQRDFTSNVSHELKTPLASIRGFAELLQKDGISDEDRREYAAIIEEESRQLSALTANILRLSKLDNSETVERSDIFSLDEQLRRVIAIMESQWSAKGIEPVVELEETEIRGNEELLREVWINLLSNAIKFTPDGGQITVRLTDGLDNAIVEIEDTGCGMTPEVKARVFDKFYQGDRSHSGEGSGLGLSIVKRIIDLSGGTIEVESIPGEGSLFRVTPPFSAAPRAC